MSRKIEQAMVSAVKQRRNWSSSNTSVQNDRRFTRIFLHGHQIGSYDNEMHELSVTLAGWNTNVTRSRVSALCRECGKTLGISNNERKGGPHLIGRDGSCRLITSTAWIEG